MQVFFTDVMAHLRGSTSQCGQTSLQGRLRILAPMHTLPSLLSPLCRPDKLCSCTRRSRSILGTALKNYADVRELKVRNTNGRYQTRVWKCVKRTC